MNPRHFTAPLATALTVVASAGLIAVASLVGVAQASPAAPEGPTASSVADPGVPAANDQAPPALNDPAPLAANDAAPPAAAVTWENRALLDNLRNGKVRSRVAFDVRNAPGDQLTATNQAVAHGACSGCRTVAFAFQVGIFTSKAPTVSANNTSAAVNENCDACVTIADARQFLLVTDRPVRLTRTGRLRLAAVEAELRRLAASSVSTDVVQQTLATLQARVVAVLADETRLAHSHGLLHTREMVCDERGKRRNQARVQPLG